MRLIPYWIQRADYSALEHGPVDVTAAVRAFREHDWNEEHRLQTQLEVSGSEFCPPGIGFIDADGPILHICPGPDGLAMVHYKGKATTRRLFGVIPSTTEPAYTRETVETATVLNLIQAFFEGRHDTIIQTLSAA